MYDILIVGSGIAGMTAAIYCLRAGLKTAIIEKDMYGGQMAINSTVENYPGIKSISGPELSRSIFEQIHDLGCEFIYDEILSCNLKNQIKIFKSKSKNYESKCVIIANGIQRRKLNCKGESEFTGKGVSYCATCDGAFFRNKKVLVVGGGNTALENCLYLSKLCKNVTIVIRKPFFRGDDILVKAIKNTPNIEIISEHIVEEIIGNIKVNSAKLKNVNDDKILNLEVDGIFIAIGYEPENSIFSNEVALTQNGYFKSNENCETNLDSVFVAGDCRQKSLRQLITAASDGAVAANQAIKKIKLG